MLTRKQRLVRNVLKASGSLKPYMRPTGSLCWRLVDIDGNPVSNIYDRTVESLKTKNVIEKSGKEYRLTEV